MENRKGAGPSDHLANERTFLAWIRTSIALMGFGFVIVKFAIFIRQITAALGDNTIDKTTKSHSAIIGVIMVAVGALVAAFGFFRYRNIEKQLNNNTFYPSMLLSVLLTLFLFVGSILLVVYLLPNI